MLINFIKGEMNKAFAILLVLSIAALAVPIEIENDHLRVVMDDTTGLFTIGDSDDTPLIDGFPVPGAGGHFIIRIDGISYSGIPGLGSSMPLLDPGTIPEDYYMSIQWIRDPIRVWEKFYFMPEESLDAFCNIELLAYNDSPDSHFVGFQIYLDIRCGANDNPVLEFATGEETTTLLFEYGDIPAYWTFYEHSTHQETTYALSQGVPFGNLMLYPEAVFFGNSAQLEIAEWFPTFIAGMPLEDLSVLIRWDPIYLSPYSWFIVQTYYGRGYPSFSIGERRVKPELFSIGRPSPNPFNSRVRVPYSILERAQHVSWSIYDLTGRVVRHSTPELNAPGDHEIFWNCRDDSGRELPSGMYLFALWADGRRETKRLVLVE